MFLSFAFSVNAEEAAHELADAGREYADARSELADVASEDSEMPEYAEIPDYTEDAEREFADSVRKDANKMLDLSDELRKDVDKMREIANEMRELSTWLALEKENISILSDFSICTGFGN